jgi:hypothetical protein
VYPRPTAPPKPASGGESESSVEEDGSFNARLVGRLDRGRSNEGRALKVLVQAMKAAGTEVERVGGARDEHGEDARLRVGTREVVVQCVSLPVESRSWQELSEQGEVRLSGTNNEAVSLLREALLHKAQKAKGTLLLLDMAQIGALVSPALVRTYRERFPDPASEFGFEQVWLVGPTTGSSQRLSE